MHMWPSIAARRVAGVAIAVTSLALGIAGAFVSTGRLYVLLAQWLFAVGIVVVSLVLIIKRPENRFGFVFAWAALGFSMMGAGQAHGYVAADAGNFSQAVTWVKVEGIGFSLFFGCLLGLIPLWFPTGRARSRLWASLAGFVLVVMASTAVAVAASGSQCVAWEESDRNTDECVEMAPARVGFLDPTWGDDLAGLLLVLGIPATVGLVVRFVKSSGVERLQLKWIAYAYVTLALVITISEVMNLDVDALAWPVALMIPGAVVVAILRYRLYEIDRLISRTVTYAVVVGLLAGVVALVATVIGTLFESPLVVAATTLLVAALFNPLRRRVQRLVERRFNRSRYDAERVLEGFAGSLRDHVDSDGIVARWVEVVSDTMHPSGVGVWVKLSN